MTTLNDLTKEEIVNGTLPIKDLLENSFYYPSAGLDGGIIKFYSKHIQSFVYCDYACGEDILLKNLDHFVGYRILAQRSVKEIELIPNGWHQQIPIQFNIHQYYKYKDSFKKPFAHWTIYERKEFFDNSHGPKRFSLLYIGGEGVATYQALYWSNKFTARALAIIQPGKGFGLNWTDFHDKNAALAWVVLNNNAGTPDRIFYGGYGSGYNDLNWENYMLDGEIKPYYNDRSSGIDIRSGEVTIWRKHQ